MWKPSGTPSRAPWGPLWEPPVYTPPPPSSSSSFSSPLTRNPCSPFLLALLLSNHSVMVRCRGRYCSGRRVSWIDGGLNRPLWRNFISLSTIESKGGGGGCVGGGEREREREELGSWERVLWNGWIRGKVQWGSALAAGGLNQAIKQRGIGSTESMIPWSNWDTCGGSDRRKNRGHTGGHNHVSTFDCKEGINNFISITLKNQW